MSETHSHQIENKLINWWLIIYNYSAFVCLRLSINEFFVIVIAIGIGELFVIQRHRRSVSPQKSGVYDHITLDYYPTPPCQFSLGRCAKKENLITVNIPTHVQAAIVL